MTITNDVRAHAVYLEIDGERWRVHDCAYSNHKFHRFVTPSSRAKYRVFVDKDGNRRGYLFTLGESRELTESRVEAQFRKAGYFSKPGADVQQWDQASQHGRA